jgi:hypothetical protein
VGWGSSPANPGGTAGNFSRPRLWDGIFIFHRKKISSQEDFTAIRFHRNPQKTGAGDRKEREENLKKNIYLRKE